MNALGITVVGGAAKAADKMASGSKLIPHSKEYVQNQVQKAQGSIKDMAKSIGKTEIPTGFKLREVADTTGNTCKVIGVDKTTIKDLAQKITAKGEGSKGEYNRDMPNEMKLIYDVKSGNFKAEYKYDLVYTNDDSKTADHIADEWFIEIKNNNL